MTDRPRTRQTRPATGPTAARRTPSHGTRRRPLNRAVLAAAGVVVAGVAVLLALVIGSGGSAGSGGSGGGVVAVQTGAAHLSTQAFADYAASATLLDVRTPEEFATGHLAGAVNIDFRSPDFAQRIAELDRTAPYAVYCHSGNRSAGALEALRAAGFTDVKDLAGGILAWNAAGLPVTTR